eukprot:609494-Amphidinium_carterae.2
MEFNTEEKRNSKDNGTISGHDRQQGSSHVMSPGVVLHWMKAHLTDEAACEVALQNFWETGARQADAAL